MRRPFIGGNWKCNGTLSSIKQLVSELNQGAATNNSVEVIVAPSALHIGLVQSLDLRKDWKISAQNVVQEKNGGAFTGEISAVMLKDMGIEYTLLGHSERRHIFGESNAVIARKVKACEEIGLTIIGCVGETLEERERGETNTVITTQLKDFGVTNWDKFVIAYEPVWAIGTGKTATPEQAQEAHKVLRDWLSQNVSSEVADKVRIIYGGSVKGDNSDELIKKPDIDGFLVGGASLKGKEFLQIVESGVKKTQQQ
ncbi:hypothetical protein FDP41_012394 [Naegleria fowleri]|uniref:Triosephosphate isomerase n=1 Tax=Naegleria fowleri TaxID=5763 RepID=A0A6A5BWU3_NAEFO|nr:uncharacterized protein FDP41_012394 [Naegleria fowleri]KAF0981737.1 hypothetical protein FDP41_012394 [Naegleria fowleri]CAG4717675.1 unnamed protein product [Naegleria fowleri]